MGLRGRIGVFLAGAVFAAAACCCRVEVRGPAAGGGESAPGGETLTADEARELNAPCYVCHTTFVGEALTAAHALRGIGCTRCHGPSEGHATDETFSTPPDTRFTKEEVDPFCRGCHPKHPEASPGEYVARWLEGHRERIPEAGEPLEVACTSCHGKHRIEG